MLAKKLVIDWKYFDSAIFGRFNIYFQRNKKNLDIKYYYENLLANQNIIAKTNIKWIADIRTLKLIRDEKSYMFFIINNLNRTGVAGFEPTNDGVKVRSLTTWRHPIKNIEESWARRELNPRHNGS